MIEDDYIDTDCYEEDDCRLQACEAKFHVAPARAIADLNNIEWWQFRLPVDLLSISMGSSASTEEYLTVGGGCEPRIKVNQVSWNISGSLYACKDDIAQCRLCRVRNCLAFCYTPCGVDFNYDVDGQDPLVQDTPVFGDPIGAGVPVRLGKLIITECTEDVTPGDYIKYDFSATGVGKEHRYNYCQSLAEYDQETIPPEFLPQLTGQAA